MKTSRKLLLSAVLVLACGLSGCVAKTAPIPEHKVKTSACLIRSTQEFPGSPEKQLAKDLVEAKVVYGLNVREVKIEKASTRVSKVLLKALQDGCVLMVSSNIEYLTSLTKFAGEHPKMLVLFVGGVIARENQPANFRWVADDFLSGAKLAGYLAAGKSETGEVQLLVQPAYYQSNAIQAAFNSGVKAFDTSSGRQTQIVFTVIRTSKDLGLALENLLAEDVVVLFAGKSIWRGFPEPSAETPFVIGADIQPGSAVWMKPNVQVSLERNTSKYLFSAVSSLLNGKVNSSPLYRKSGAIKFGTNELKVLKSESLDGTLLDELAAYRQDLLTNLNG